MSNDNFLQKFKGRTEIMGKDGHLGVINNLRSNIIGYQRPPQKVPNVKIKRKKFLDNDYSYVKSIVKEDFNKNIDFIPQLKKLSTSTKLIDHNENIKINNNNNSIIIKNDERNNYINNNIPKNIKNNYNMINKSVENPNRLFKYAGSNNYISRDNFKGSNMNKNLKNLNTNNISMKLPLIVSQGKTIEDNTFKNRQIKTNKSFENKNSFNPDLKNNIMKQNIYQKINNIPLENNINDPKEYTENNNNMFKDEYPNNKIKLQRFNINKKHNNLSSRNIRQNKSITIDNDIVKAYNNILNNIQNNFELLDSLKRKMNKMQKNKSYINRKDNNNPEINNINNSYQRENININNIDRSYNIKPINKKNIYLNNDKNNYDDNNITNKKNMYNNNNNDIIYNLRERKNNNMLPDNTQRLLGINNKFNIINEKEEDKNIRNNNNNNNKQNENFIEILMKQRLNYQNKIPNNSIFKINPAF